MDYLPPTQCADTYTDGLTVGPNFTCDHAAIIVGTGSPDDNPVLYQVAQGSPGDWVWTDEREFTAIPQAFDLKRVVGVRFRNATPGQIATVQAWLLGKTDPDIQPGTLFTLGKPSTQTILAAVGAGVYNAPPTVRSILIECIGGGGGGAGAVATAAGQAAVGGGGGGGGYAARLFPKPPGLLTLVGGGGVGGAGAAGGAGGPTTVRLPTLAALASAPGGGGGAIVAAGATASAARGGNGGALGTGDITLTGDDGEYGIFAATGIIIGGKGGAAARGGGGGVAPFNASGNGLAGGLYGGGGSGAMNGVSQAAKTGGAGAQGIVIITEFY